MLSKTQILDSSGSQDEKLMPNVKFFDWVSKREIMAIQSNDTLQRLFSKRTWDLEHGQYRQVSDSELFSLVSEVRIERLNLSKNKKPNLVRQIKEVSFPLLTKLLLNDNFITSLEFIDHLDCPNLQAIALMNNKIVQIRSFKKTKFPHLNYIALEKNPIRNLSAISMMESGNFNQLLIQVDRHDKVLGHDIIWMAKIQSPELRQISKFSNKIRMSCRKQNQHVKDQKDVNQKVLRTLNSRQFQSPKILSISLFQQHQKIFEPIRYLASKANFQGNKFFTFFHKKWKKLVRFTEQIFIMICL